MSFGLCGCGVLDSVDLRFWIQMIRGFGILLILESVDHGSCEFRIWDSVGFATWEQGTWAWGMMDLGIMELGFMVCWPF